MRVLGSTVLACEAIIVLLATALASSTGSLSNVALAWTAGVVLIVLLVLTMGMLGRRSGITLGWIMQLLVLASSLVVGWAMAVVAVIFTVLWYLAVRFGTRVDRMRASAGANTSDPNAGPAAPEPPG